MITAWIIQPQIEKSAEQRKQLDSLRVDMKVEIFILKKDFSFNAIMTEANKFFKRQNYNGNNKGTNRS